MKFNTNLWDITKALCLVAVILFVWVKGSDFIDKFNTKSELPPEIRIQLQENQALIANMRASNQELKNLILELKSKDGQQARLIEYVEAENKKKDARIDELGVIVAKLDRSVNKLRTPATVAKTPALTGDPEEDKRREELAYEYKQIDATDTNGEKFPIAWAMYSPNKPPDERWKTGTYDLEFNVTVVESETEEGTYDRAVSAHIENNTNPETIGKEYPIPLPKSNIIWAKAEPPPKKFRWWSPRLGAGMTFTPEDMAPKIDISLSSYGRSKRDIDWRFFTFGVGAAKGTEEDSNEWKGIFSFELASWNVGNVLPLVENLFVAPVVTYDTDDKASVGVSLSIPF
jgi:hypothetical protein